jgi:uncharacterized protein with PIN domain
MNEAQLYFVGGLSELIPSGKRKTPIIYQFTHRTSIKHIIESYGVPHTEVNQIIINNATNVDFSYILENGDMVEIVPSGGVGNNSDYSLQKSIKTPPTFILDTHLGKLAKYLRVLGFDALYHNDYKDETLAQTASEESRILLSRDRRLLMRKIICYGYLIRSLDPYEQLLEVAKRFRLIRYSHPFNRCLRCNYPLESIAKEEIIDRLEPLTKKYYQKFKICPNCSQIYWMGSHYKKMLLLIDRLKKDYDKWASFEFPL